MRKPRLFKYSVGRRGNRVVVQQRKLGGAIYGRAFDPFLRSGRGDYRWCSLRHRDEQRARLWAAEQHHKLLKGKAEQQAGRVTLGTLCALYITHKTPKKKRLDEQAADRRRAACWIAFLGADRDVREITRRDWDEFVARRTEGSLDAHGEPVPLAARRPTRARTVAMDCIFLRRLCAWAVEEHDDRGRRLLDVNPLARFSVPSEKNVRRPVVDATRLTRLRAIANGVTWAGPDRRPQISCFPELLDLAVATGRRVSALCALTYADVQLAAAPHAPHGSIHWRGEDDKMGYDDVAPLNLTARAAIMPILAERPGIGNVPLFPDPRDPARPLSRHVAAALLRRAERLAGLEHIPGGGWHALRRRFASEADRRGASLADIARAGGWRDKATLLRSYLQADPVATLAVIMSADEPLEGTGQ